MTLTAGIDVGSTYTKAVLLNDEGRIVGLAMHPTGFKLGQVAEQVYRRCLADARLDRQEVRYVVATGIGRHQVGFKDVQATDLTAAARGARFLFPGTRTVLDVGGQTMKASRLDEGGRVTSFRLNDKCAAGTGAFLEKTARYMGYSTEQVGPLAASAKEPAPISGVCAVFAESEVINNLSLGVAAADIMQGAIVSLVGRSVQLMKRMRAEPEYTLVGGILRFDTMARAVRGQLNSEVNVPEASLVQYVSALGAAVLGQRRLQKMGSSAEGPAVGTERGLASGRSGPEHRSWRRRVMSKPERTRCVECEGGLNRRGFLRVVGGAALVAVGSRAAAGGSAASRPLGPAGAAPAVSAARRLYESLTAEQRELLLLPWSDPRRDKVSPNWKIVKATIGQTFSQEQRELVREIVRSVTSEDGFARFSRQMNDDWGGLDNYTCAFFGRPDAGPFQWELTGRHVTLRAGGASAQGRAFGGPIVYGHAPQFNERPGHPGNVFWYQAKRANELFAMLDGRQRRQALLERAPPETAVALRPSATSRPGICVAELSPDQRQLVAQVFEDILAPYCDPARRQAKAILAGGGGLDRLHVAFYKQGDIGNDSIWDIWRLEGPTVVCHFRGAPHIHAYINIGRRS